VAAKEVDTIPRIAPSGFAPGNAAEGFLEMAVIYFVPTFPFAASVLKRHIALQPCSSKMCFAVLSI